MPLRSIENMKPICRPLQPKQHAVGVRELSGRPTAGDREAGAGRGINARDIARSMQMIRRADEIRARNADGGAGADAAD